MFTMTHGTSETMGIPDFQPWIYPTNVATSLTLPQLHPAVHIPKSHDQPLVVLSENTRLNHPFLNKPTI